MSPSLRVDPDQRFTCSQCGRCCRGWDVIVSDTEIALYRRRNASAWFSGGGDPVEPIPQHPGVHRIRKREDGACGFLSVTNRCRIHEQLGADRKPLTCRMFPFSFHAAPEGVAAIASFACPTITANEGAPVSPTALEVLRKEWGGTRSSGPLELVKGRSIDPRSSRLLRDNLLAMLRRDDADIRVNIRRIAATLDDLSRSRVIALGDAQFAEYVSLTVPHAATSTDEPPRRGPGLIARLLQHGFLYTVVATRVGLEYPRLSATQARLARLHLLAHFHGLAPGRAGIDVRAVRRHRVDINAPAIRPLVFHYLRSTLETLGAQNRPLIDELAIQVSYVNTARSLAAMKAYGSGRDADREIFSEALIATAGIAHATNRWLAAILKRFSGGTESLWTLAS